MPPDPRVSVVVISRDRGDELLASLARTVALPEAPRVHYVDNGSTDGSPGRVREAFPGRVEVVALEENRGSAARTVGVQRASTSYVAFCDDDSWWRAGDLARAADLLDADLRLALVNARILVGEQERPDPTCVAMAASPLPLAPGQVGTGLLSSIACGVVVRRDAYLAVGGFHPRLGVGGEEALLGWDLATAGWRQSYVDELVVHHHPSPVRDRDARAAGEVRNALWTTWLRRPAPAVARETARAAVRAVREPGARRGVGAALRGLPWVLRERRVWPPALEAQKRLLD